MGVKHESNKSIQSISCRIISQPFKEIAVDPRDNSFDGNKIVTETMYWFRLSNKTDTVVNNSMVE